MKRPRTSSLSRKYGPLLAVAGGGLALFGGAAASEAPAASEARNNKVLWLTNDSHGSLAQTNLKGRLVHEVPDTPSSGVAFDGTHLYVGSFDGTITERTLDGDTVLRTFFVDPQGEIAEDMAWDTVRERLWRVTHADPVLQRIDPVTEQAEETYPLPIDDPDPELSPRGALGLAYDNRRDLLYVSFCQQGCEDFDKGVVLVVDPGTGTVLDELFRTDGFDTAGLAFKKGPTDVLWVGSDVSGGRDVRRMTLSGQVLSQFTAPPVGQSIDGLEYACRIPLQNGKCRRR